MKNKLMFGRVYAKQHPDEFISNPTILPAFATPFGWSQVKDHFNPAPWGFHLFEVMGSKYFCK